MNSQIPQPQQAGVMQYITQKPAEQIFQTPEFEAQKAKEKKYFDAESFMVNQVEMIRHKVFNTTSGAAGNPEKLLTPFIVSCDSNSPIIVKRIKGEHATLIHPPEFKGPEKHNREIQDIEKRILKTQKWVSEHNKKAEEAAGKYLYSDAESYVRAARKKEKEIEGLSFKLDKLKKDRGPEIEKFIADANDFLKSINDEVVEVIENQISGAEAELKATGKENKKQEV